MKFQTAALKFFCNECRDQLINYPFYLKYSRNSKLSCFDKSRQHKISVQRSLYYLLFKIWRIADQKKHQKVIKCDTFSISTDQKFACNFLAKNGFNTEINWNIWCDQYWMVFDWKRLSVKTNNINNIAIKNQFSPFFVFFRTSRPQNIILND